jgi:hypothetical protein
MEVKMSDSNETTTSSSIDLWSDEQEKVVKSWGEEAHSYAWLHHRCGQWFDRCDKIITIPSIVLPIVIGSSLFAEYTNILAVKITYACLLIISSAITALQTYLAWSKRAACHTEGSLQYQFFADDIRSELAMPRNSRTHGFFMKAREKRKTMLTSYPAIIARYENMYRRKFGNLPVAKPIITDTIPEIQINTEDNPNTSVDKAAVPVELIRKENQDRYIQYQIERSIANGLIN